MISIFWKLFLLSAMLSDASALFSQSVSQTKNDNSKIKAMDMNYNKELVRKLYEDILNPKKLDRVPEVIHPDFRSADGIRGLDGYKANVSGVFEAFPDLQFEIKDLLADGDRVVARWIWKATNTGSFRGFPPTHKAVTNTAIIIYKIKDGKLFESWLEADRLSVMQQIGAVKH